VGSGSVSKKTTSPQDIIDYLDDLFAYALSIGMTYEQYWYQDPKLIKSYVKAEEYRQMRSNQDKWLQGLYNHIALNVSLSNAFNKHAHSKYLEKPIALSKKEQEIEEEARVNRIYNKLNAIAKANESK
jgi:hypothetical protein